MTYRYSALVSAILLIAAFAARPAAAQITVTSEDLTELIGESLQLSTLFSTDAQLQAVVEAEGADQTWDFTGITVSDTMHANAMYYGSGEGLPGGDSFPEANYAVELRMGIESAEVDSAVWIFGRITSDSAHTLGGSYLMEDPESGVRDTTTLFYDPPQLDFELPLSYGVTWSDTSSFFGIETVTRSEVDGWGTIILPDGSSHKALRVRREETTSAFGFDETSTFIDLLTTSQAVSVHLSLAEDNTTFASAEIMVNRVPTAAEEDELPQAFRLLQNHPNPFNPSTTLTYELATSQQVTLTVHDLLGRQVAVLVDGVRAAGEHEVGFDGSGLPSGTYIYRLRTAAGTQSRVMTLAK